MPSVHPRCGQHGLVAPDGLCVLCRKASSGPPQPQPQPEAPQESAGKFAALLAGLALLTMGATFVLSWSAGQDAGRQPSAALAVAPSSDPLEPDLSDLDKSKAKDLAASLELLERSSEERDRAEEDRVQQQQLVAAHAEEQRINAAAELEQETHEREAARHDAVTRELAEKKLQP